MSNQIIIGAIKVKDGLYIGDEYASKVKCDNHLFISLYHKGS